MVVNKLGQCRSQRQFDAATALPCLPTISSVNPMTSGFWYRKQEEAEPGSPP